MQARHQFFKDDYWDEIRDMARRAREYHTEYDLDMLDTNPKAPQPLDFRKFLLQIDAHALSKFVKRDA